MAAPRLKPHDPSEFIRLIEWVKGSTSILEIGSRFGYTLVDLAHCMNGKGRVVSVDLPDAEGWNDRLSAEAIAHLTRNLQQLRDEGYDVHFFEGDSKDPEIVEAVNRLGPFDTVFIDGDHTHEGVVSDWLNYGHLGKQVIFHDIREPQPPEWMGMGVWKLWNVIKEEPNTEQFLAPGSKMGIGRICKK
jgi:cephalosporin hydroxylase